MIKRIIIVLVLVILAGYLIAAMTILNKPKNGRVCEQVEILIEDNTEFSLIDEEDIEKHLVRKKVYPKGKAMKEINLHELEKTLQNSPYIQKATCYKTASGTVCIKIVPLQVILHIMSENGENYYLDNSGQAVPKSTYFADMPIATGHIDKQYARLNLTSLGKFIQSDPFWNNQIEQIHVRQDGCVELTPRIGKHTIVLGEPKDLRKKFNKLKTFYKKGLSQVGWNKYSEINLEYKDQIICTKNKNQHGNR